jgi:uncharacterized protein YecA (UPF0149 family)
MVAPLVALMLDTLDESSQASKLQNYAMIHAGRVLLYWREPSAIPAFAALYLHDQDAVDWFQDSIAAFGPDAVQPFREVLLSDTGLRWHYGKSFMADVLAYIALLYPETRSDVLSALHAALPPLNSDGGVDYPTGQARDENWDSIVMALAMLQDESSRALALALFDAQMLQEEIMVRDDYLRMMKEGGKVPANVRKYDLPTEVRENWEEEQTRLRRLAREEARPQARRAPASDVPKVGRNQPCPCGSGKKYKHCHGKKG